MNKKKNLCMCVFIPITGSIFIGIILFMVYIFGALPLKETILENDIQIKNKQIIELEKDNENLSRMLQDTNRYTENLNDDRDNIEHELTKSKEDF